MTLENVFYMWIFFAATKWICWKHWVSVGHIVFLFHNFSSIEICSPTDVKRSLQPPSIYVLSAKSCQKRSRKWGNEESKKDWKAFLSRIFHNTWTDWNWIKPRSIQMTRNFCTSVHIYMIIPMVSNALKHGTQFD